VTAERARRSLPHPAPLQVPCATRRTKDSGANAPRNPRNPRLVELVGRYSKLANLSKLCQITPGDRIPIAPPRIHAVERRLSAETIQQIVDEYNAGAPSTELMQRYNLSKSAVLDLLRKHGATLRKRKRLSPSERRRSVELYEAGWSLARIGEELGRGPTVIWRVLKHAGVELRPRNGWQS
jgi:hypothetical protein